MKKTEITLSPELNFALNNAKKAEHITPGVYNAIWSGNEIEVTRNSLSTIPLTAFLLEDKDSIGTIYTAIEVFGVQYLRVEVDKDGNVFRLENE